MSTAIITERPEQAELRGFRCTHYFLKAMLAEGAAEAQRANRQQIEAGLARLTGDDQAQARRFIFNDRLPPYSYAPLYYRRPQEAADALLMPQLASYYAKLSSAAHGGFFGLGLFRDQPDTIHPDQRRQAGRAKIQEIIPARALDHLRALRRTGPDRRFGGGTPDLFLYDDVGRYKFVEVKKGRDQLRPPQLRCLAQIARALRCGADIVYLCAVNQAYAPKTYVLDLQRCEGWRQSPNKPLHLTPGLAPFGRSVRRR